MKYSREETFRMVYCGLKAQDFRQSVTAYGCAYRGIDGARCAVGVLIPDEEYREGFEGEDVNMIYHKVPALQSHDCEFLSVLQNAHDISLSPEEIKARLLNIAKSRGFNTSEYA